jgi:carboxymethylenebutenolidase
MTKRLGRRTVSQDDTESCCSKNRPEAAYKRARRYTMEFFEIARGNVFLALAVLAFFPVADARAVTLDQAKAQCHDKFVPVVRECVRRKVSQIGGSPATYIPICRDSIMPAARDCVAKALTSGGPADPEIDIPSPSGSGRVVMILSGIDGTAPYKPFAEKVAKLGYYVVVIDGRQILSEDKLGGDRLAKAIAAAQSSSIAKPGKIAVIGFSAGGGGALAYAERQPDTVAMVITYYPATSFIAKVSDMKSFVDKFQVPLLAFAGGKDTFRNCCMLATIQSMKATSRDLGKSMDLVVYPDAQHDFIKDSIYREADSEDAWKRTTAALAQYLGDPSVH